MRPSTAVNIHRHLAQHVHARKYYSLHKFSLSNTYFTLNGENSYRNGVQMVEIGRFLVFFFTRMKTSQPYLYRAGKRQQMRLDKIFASARVGLRAYICEL